MPVEDDPVSPEVLLLVLSPELLLVLPVLSPEVLLLVLPLVELLLVLPLVELLLVLPLVELLLVLPLVVVAPGTDTNPVFEFPPKISAAKMLPLAFATMRSLTNAFATWNKISPVNLLDPPLPHDGQLIPKSQKPDPFACNGPLAADKAGMCASIVISARVISIPLNRNAWEAPAPVLTHAFGSFRCAKTSTLPPVLRQRDAAKRRGSTTARAMVLCEVKGYCLHRRRSHQQTCYEKRRNQSQSSDTFNRTSGNGSIGKISTLTHVFSFEF